MTDIESKYDLPVWDGKSEYIQHLIVLGRNCWIRNNGQGYLCGYVEISDEELFFAPRDTPEDIYSDFDVHGGITWEGGDIEGITTQEFSTLIGFDTAHLGDAPHPASETAQREKVFREDYRPLYESMNTYKDEQYVFRELINLVVQVDQIHVAHKCKRPGV